MGWGRCWPPGSVEMYGWEKSVSGKGSEWLLKSAAWVPQDLGVHQGPKRTHAENDMGWVIDGSGPAKKPIIYNDTPICHGGFHQRMQRS